MVVATQGIAGSKTVQRFNYLSTDSNARARDFMRTYERLENRMLPEDHDFRQHEITIKNE